MTIYISNSKANVIKMLFIDLYLKERVATVQKNEIKPAD